MDAAEPLRSPPVQAAIRAGRREFVLEIRRVGSTDPLTTAELQQIVKHMVGFDQDPLTRDLAGVENMAKGIGGAKAAAYTVGAVANINKLYQEDRLVGMRNQPYHLSYRDSFDRWHHYQAYEVT